MAVHPTAIIEGNVKISRSADIGAYCVLTAHAPSAEIVIADGVVLGHHSVVTGNVTIGRNTVSDSHTQLGPNTKVGERCHLLYGARLHDHSIVGDDCVIAGNVPDQTSIGNRVVHLGRLAHSLHYPFDDWDGPTEIGPTIEDEVIISVEALVIGPVHIGSNSLIMPREIVRSNIPANSVVRGGEAILTPHWRTYLRALGAAKWSLSEGNGNYV